MLRSFHPRTTSIPAKRSPVGMLAICLVVCSLVHPAFAQPTSVPAKPVKAAAKPPEYDMERIDLRAKDRKVMLMTFLERASEELERATLRHRSFIPELVKTIDAESL